VRYLAADSETGGLDQNTHSILTLYLAVLDEKFNVVSELDLKIKPDDGAPYIVTGEALAINRIDLAKHDKEASTVTDAATKIYYFLKKESSEGTDKLMFLGHNVSFDEGFILSQLIKKKVWNLFVSYHKVDTVPVAQFLKLQGKIPKQTPLNLEKLAVALGIRVNRENLHTARGDTLLCVEVLKAMLSL